MSDTLNIYWSPANFTLDEESWIMLYSDPKNILSDIYDKRNPDAKHRSFLSCPAFKDKLKNVFMFDNIFDSEYYYKGSIVESIGQSAVGFYSQRQPSINIGPLLTYNMSWLFFSEEPVDCFFTSPYFHKAEYLASGALVPGKFNIGSWFRPFNLEMQMYSNEGNIKFNKDEPLFYMDINTNKKINFIRFNMNKKIHSLSQEAVRSPERYKKFMPLKERYSVFKNSKMRDIILNEIKKEVIETDRK
jgi:hypothetical protein